MNEPVYAVVAGNVQYKPEHRDINGIPVQKIKIRSLGSQKIINLTLWREHSQASVQRGDFLFAEGRVRTTTGRARDGSSREYIDMDVSSIAAVPAYEPEPTPEEYQAYERPKHQDVERQPEEHDVRF